MSSENKMDPQLLSMTLTAEIIEKPPASDEEPLAKELQPQSIFIQMWNGLGFKLAQINYVRGRNTPESVAFELRKRGVLVRCDVDFFIEKLNVVVTGCVADPTTPHVQHFSLTTMGLSNDSSSSEDEEDWNN